MVDKMSPYFRVAPGEEKTVQYMGFRMIPNKFDPEKDTFQYTLMVDNTKKFWETGSPAVAYAFDKMQEGDIASVKNIGVDKKPKYQITPIITKDGQLNTDPSPENEILPKGKSK